MNLYLNRFMGTVFLNVKLILEPHQVYFKHFHLPCLEQLVTSLTARIKPFMDRILCLPANTSVSRRMITGGDDNCQKCKCSPITVTKSFKGKAGPYKTCFF